MASTSFPGQRALKRPCSLGATAREAGKALGCSAQTASYRAKRLGLELRADGAPRDDLGPGEPWRPGPARLELVHAGAWERGATSAEVARVLGETREEARARMAEAGPLLAGRPAAATAPAPV